ncbi:MAG: hypothetical protein GY719_21620 [bacterium]|nr:hypothetical protein [bacterium]
MGALLILALVGSDLGAGELSFSAVPVSDSVSKGDPVLVRVTLSNDAALGAAEPVFFVLVPRLVVGARPMPEWPYLQVTFEVTDPDGRRMEAQPPPELGKLAEPQLNWLEELHAGEFFGRTVDLSSVWIGFRFQKSGAYTIRARLSCGARQWLDAWLHRNGTSSGSLPFSYEHVFGGSLESEPLRIVVE